MPYSYAWESNHLIREFTDVIQPADILASNFEIHAHSQFPNIDYIINDFTKVTALDINNSHTKIYATTDDIISDTKGKLKIAIVAVQEEHIALAENYRQGITNRHWKCEIFSTVADAKKWAEA